ncbi:unnamed protein product [Paramecium sonneborni]|uniref:Uncharacterized protein n=1 Tax=Paramecium sonneborni TaxID=65129 RepID=A0A8S1QN64_9CILI|nr:unnamed protein product [Paramecium sonneborni]
MEQILFLIQLLYNENQSIRTNSQIELNKIFRDIQNIQKGFQQLLLPFPNQNLKLQYFVFLKNFVMENYDQTPKYLQKEIQNIILDQMNKLDFSLIPFYCELINFIIQKQLPSLEIVQFIINQNSYDNCHIKIITEMMNNPFIKVKLQLTQYHIITNKMIKYYNWNDMQKLNLLSDLYISLINSIFKFDQLIQNEINLQFCEIFTYHQYQYDLLIKFLRVIHRLNENRLPHQELQIKLFDFIMQTFIENENQIIDKYLAYKILQVFQPLLSYRQIDEYQQEKIIIFTLINLIMLEEKQYINLFINQRDDSKQDYLLIKIRKYGTQFIHYIIGYFSEEILIKQIFCLKDLINNYQQKKYDYIKLEAQYFVINENISLIPIYIFDDKFINETFIILQEQNVIYIPLKMQVLELLKKLILKNVIELNQMNIFITILQQQLNPNIINYPNYICKIVNNLIYLHSLQPSKNLISYQTFVDLKNIYQVQQKLMDKEAILNTLCELVGLEQGNYSDIIQLIENEWQIELQEKHQYKYRQGMILNVFSFMIQIWQFKLLNIVSIGIIKMVKECLIQNSHQTKGLQVLSALLRKQIANSPINFKEIQDDIKQIQELFIELYKDEPDFFNQIIQIYYLFLLLDIADYKITFQFLLQHNQQICKNQQLTLLCLLFCNLKQGNYQELIIQNYCAILQEKIIQDEVRTYSELICGLSILDFNQYDVKHLLIEIQRTLSNNKMINIMIQRATNYIKYNIPNYINYLINFFNCMLFKQHIVFDLEQLTIENENSQSLSQSIKKMRSDLIPNNLSLINQIIELFEIKFNMKMEFCKEIVQKLKLDASRLQIQTEEEIRIQQFHID